MKHYNTSLSQDAVRIFNTKGTDSLPPEVANVIQPVVNLQRVTHIMDATSKSTSGGTDYFTAPTDKDFYVTELSLGMIKDATCDASNGSATIKLTVDGNAETIIALPILTLTAQEQHVHVSLCTPIKIDRGSDVRMETVTYSAGSMTRTASVAGYTVETTR